MTAIVIITLTGLILVATLLRDAMAASPDDRMIQSGRHPLILLLGSLLSLMALFSIVRSLPAERAAEWPIAFHVGFICLWLVLMSRRGAPPLEKSGESQTELDG